MRSSGSAAVDGRARGRAVFTAAVSVFSTGRHELPDRPASQHQNQALWRSTKPSQAQRATTQTNLTATLVSWRQ